MRWSLALLAAAALHASPARADDCPGDPPMAEGLTFYPGAVPKSVQDWAVAVRESNPMGAVVRGTVDGQEVVGRVEHHTYQARTGKHGCFKGVTVYVPKDDAVRLAAAQRRQVEGATPPAIAKNEKTQAAPVAFDGASAKPRCTLNAGGERTLERTLSPVAAAPRSRHPRRSAPGQTRKERSFRLADRRP